jgi:hypothetical protein
VSRKTRSVYTPAAPGPSRPSTRTLLDGHSRWPAASLPWPSGIGLSPVSR